jgi:hypothetical protein
MEALAQMGKHFSAIPSRRDHILPALNVAASVRIFHVQYISSSEGACYEHARKTVSEEVLIRGAPTRTPEKVMMPT